MPQFTLPYGKQKLTFSLDDALHVELIAPKVTTPAADPLAAVAQALDNPVGLPSGLAAFAGAKSAAVAVNDKTRPVPNHHLLPPLLSRLEGLGIAPEKITLIIASGTHTPMTPDEFGAVIPPEILNRYPVISHDSDDKTNLTYLGTTERDTAVWVNRHFAAADLKIVTGNIEPHQFMGFSGGVKSAAVGVGGRETINHNHAMMTHERAQLARYHDNPMRQDVEEIGKLIGIDLALNSILNDHKQIVRAIAGNPVAVMQTGIPLVRELYQVPVAAPFDLMIVSPGGNPKDLNMYQAQKGMAHAAMITKTGGTLILTAACPDGTGGSAYEDWVLQFNSHAEVLDKFARSEFKLGQHKAYQISRDASRMNVILVSEMEAEFVRRLLLNPAPSLDAALATALVTLPSDARIGVMPLGNTTVPLLK